MPPPRSTEQPLEPKPRPPRASFWPRASPRPAPEPAPDLPPLLPTPRLPLAPRVALRRWTEDELEFFLRGETCLRHCRFEGEGLHGGVAGKACHFQCTSMDVEERQRSSGGDKFSLAIVPAWKLSSAKSAKPETPTFANTGGTEI